MNFAVLSPAEGRRQRVALMRDIRREEKRKIRAHLGDLRQQIRETRAQRKAALAEAKQRCRNERLAARERARATRERVLQELRATLLAERFGARQACAVRMAQARSINDRIHRTRAELEAERAHQADMRRIERGHRQRTKEVHRASARERRSESDDAVLQNLPPEYHALWNRVKGSIRGSDRKSRTEAFLEYAEAHPAEWLEGIETKTDAVIRELETRHSEMHRSLREPHPPVEEPMDAAPESYEGAFAGL